MTLTVPLTHSRVSELLVYATVYGEFNEATPNGTTSDIGGPMNDLQRGAIIAYKKVLGLLPEDYPFTPAAEPTA